jgi:hypothetical protein
MNCEAKTRSGTPCKKVAGWGTDHLGQGRCRLHGGATPIKSGRYSKIKRDPIRKLIEGYETDPDPLNILPEIAAARALFQDFVERYDEWRAALLSWHESYSESAKPRMILDVADAHRLLAAIAKIAQQEKRLELDGAISQRDLLRVLTEMRAVVDREVADTTIRERILTAWNGIRLG